MVVVAGILPYLDADECAAAVGDADNDDGLWKINEEEPRSCSSVALLAIVVFILLRLALPKGQQLT